jgi:hypothetical protein
MPLPKHPLTQDEVVRAEIMAMRITMTIILNAFLQEHPNRDAVLNEFEGLSPIWCRKSRLRRFHQLGSRLFGTL